MFRVLALIALLGGSAAAACPPGQPVGDALFERLRTAGTEAEGRAAEGEIWQRWTKAPTAGAQELLDGAMSRIGWGDPAGAETSLDELVVLCPTYAEGYNQRAFARFLSNDLDGALEDLDRAIELEPRHFGALAGKALTLLRQGRARLAQLSLAQAVALHPWLKERHLLVPESKT